MVDIFERLEKNAGGPIGMYMGYAHGYFAFPKLEGEIGPHMTFRGQKMLNWSPVKPNIFSKSSTEPRMISAYSKFS